jgi:predicted NBD/HSP70 family sugar kinase
MRDSTGTLNVFSHAARTLTAVTVDSFNEELREDEGFVGDRASGKAFRTILDRCRHELEAHGHEDPFGDAPSREISKSKLDKILAGGDPLAAATVHTAVEEFAQELADVVRRFLQRPAWQLTERIVFGGGLMSSHIGQLAMGRAAILLAEQRPVDLQAIQHHPDEAGLLGALQLAPSWVLEGHEGMLAVDIGGTNIRAGLIRFKVKHKGIAKAEVAKLIHWRHADDKPSREEAIDRLAEMLKELIGVAHEQKLKLAPFVGVACPGLIDERGIILRGGQNLPGNWEGEGFSLVEHIVERLEHIGRHETVVVLHNDAVVQGLSEVPNLRDVTGWGVLTIGTGLGNAHFTNRHIDSAAASLVGEAGKNEDDEGGKKAKRPKPG